MKKALIAVFLVIALFGFTGCDIIMGILGISTGSVDLTASISVVSNDRVQITISNSGTDPAENVSYFVVLTTNPTSFGIQDPKVHEGYANVAAGYSSSATVYFDDFTLTGIDPDDYYIGVIVDPNNYQVEDSETNNKARTSGTVYFGETGGGDGDGGVAPDVHEPDDTMSQASFLPDGNHQIHTIEAGDSDWIRFDGNSGTDYTVYTYFPGTGLSMDTVLYIYDSAGQSLFNDDDSGADFYSSITFTANYTGSFYIQVVGINDAEFGDYAIQLNNDGGAFTNDFTIEVTYIGRNTVDSQAPLIVAVVNLDAPNPETTYAYDILTSTYGEVVISQDDMPMITNDGYGVLIIHDVNATFGTLGNDTVGPRGWYKTGETGNLIYTFDPINVSRMWPSDSISVTFTPPGDVFEYDDQSDFASYIDVGQTQVHWINAGDVDWIAFDAVAGINYVIETDDPGLGDPMDTVLHIYDSTGAGTELWYDDDGGNGYYSQISFVATYTGTHFIKVVGINDYDEGDYELFVDATDGTIDVTVQ